MYILSSYNILAGYHRDETSFFVLTFGCFIKAIDYRAIKNT